MTNFANKDFKQTEVWLIPKNWEVFELWNFCKIQWWYAFKSKDFIKVWTPVIKIGDIKDWKIIISNNTSYVSSKLLYNDLYIKFNLNYWDILIAMTGATTGKVGKYLLKEISLLNQRVWKFIILNSQRLCNNFIYFFSQTPLFQKKITNNILISAQWNISPQKIESIKIPYPPINEQQKIANILGKIQDAIENQDKIIKTTIDLKKSMMDKLFSEWLNWEKQKETEIWLMPESWEVKKVEEIYDFTSKPKNLKITKEQEIPFIPMENISEEYLYIHNYEFRKNISSWNYIENGDLLVAKITPSFENWKQWIVNLNDFEYWYATTEIIALKDRTNISDKYYLFYYLKKQNIRSYLAWKMEWSTWRQRLSKETLKNLIIPVPSYKEQTEITDIFKRLDNKINIAKKKKLRYEELFKTMLNLLMTGQIRTKDLDLSLT